MGDFHPPSPLKSLISVYKKAERWKQCEIFFDEYIQQVWEHPNSKANSILKYITDLENHMDIEKVCSYYSLAYKNSTDPEQVIFRLIDYLSKNGLPLEKIEHLSENKRDISLIKEIAKNYKQPTERVINDGSVLKRNANFA